MADIPSYLGDEQIQAMRQAIVDLQEGGPGGGVTLGTYSGAESYAGTTENSYDLSGAPGNVALGAVVVDDPPDWISAAGVIILPGLYVVTAYFRWDGDPPVDDGYLYGPSVFNLYSFIPYAVIPGGSQFRSPGPDIQALGEGDVPYGITSGFAFTTTVDAPTELLLRYEVFRAAMPS